MNSRLIVRLAAQSLRDYLLENDPESYEAEMEKFWRIVSDR